MCHSHAKNNKINRLHERCLRIIYNDKVSTFEQLLEKDSSASMCTRNLRFLAIEMFAIVKGLAPTIINDLFPLKATNNYNLRHKLFFKIPRNETVRNGFETISYLGPNIWKMLPSEMQEYEALFEFKYKVKSWNPINCPCKLSKTYIGGVEYVWMMEETAWQNVWIDAECRNI